jgi:hypothetical protein
MGEHPIQRSHIRVTTKARSTRKVSFLTPTLGMQCWTLHGGAEEVLQLLEGLLGTFFLQEVAAVETASGNC